MCKRCRSFFSLLKNSEDFDTRRKEEAFKKQKEENFSSEVFPWSSFEDDEDDDDSDDDSDAMMKKKSSGRARRRHRGREMRGRVTPTDRGCSFASLRDRVDRKVKSFEGFR